MSISPMDKMRLLSDAADIIGADKIEPYVIRVLEETFDTKPTTPVKDDDEQLRLVDFVREKGVEPLRGKILHFGAAVKAAYVAAHGHAPKLVAKQYVYTQADRQLMETVWDSNWMEA